MTESDSRLTIPNTALLQVPPQILVAALQQFMAAPLPVLVRLDLAPVVKTIGERSSELFQTKLDLLKQYGAVETDPGMWSLEDSAPGYAEYHEEFHRLSDADSKLPLSEKVKCPVRVTFMGRQVDIVLDGLAESVLSHIVEWER